MLEVTFYADNLALVGEGLKGKLEALKGALGLRVYV